jgi:aryl-alcohol dehydrogenase
MQTRAAVMPERHGRWTIDTLEVAEPGPQEVLVRVVASGMCQTDVHARDGFFPIPCSAVYGHEGAGVVERVGRAVTTLKPGDHVILANPSRGACPECLAGFETYCSNAPMLKHSGYRADGTSLSFRPVARNPSTARSSSSPRLPASRSPWRAIRSGCLTMYHSTSWQPSRAG